MPFCDGGSSVFFSGNCIGNPPKDLTEQPIDDELGTSIFTRCLITYQTGCVFVLLYPKDSRDSELLVTRLESEYPARAPLIKIRQRANDVIRTNK